MTTRPESRAIKLVPRDGTTKVFKPQQRVRTLVPMEGVNGMSKAHHIPHRLLLTGNRSLEALCFAPKPGKHEATS